MDVAIIGAGASGVLLALALATRAPHLTVGLIEPNPVPGRGLAYDETDPAIRLNVGAARMSALAGRPDDFVRWIDEVGEGGEDIGKAFLSRGTYGRYLGDRLGQLAPEAALIAARVRNIVTDANGARLDLHDGRTLQARAAVLATGHSWVGGRDGERPVPTDRAVGILGTGLTMVDRWLRLRSAGYAGPIIAVSRHGIGPLDHGTYPDPIALENVPLGAPVSATMRWLRRQAAAVDDWRKAVDGLRPHTQALWQAWTTEQRRRFLRHARRYWDVHRHRIAADISMRLQEERDTGQMRIERSGAAKLPAVDFDCRGYVPDFAHLANPLIASLIADGTVRPDPLRIGLDVTTGLQLIDATGNAHARFFAVGPITRGLLWEIEAVPDIRQQAADLAERLGRAG